MRINDFIGKTASRIVGSSNAKIVLITKEKENQFKLVLFSEDKEKILRTIYSVNISNLPEGSVSQIKAIINDAVRREIIKKNEYVFCVTDQTLGKDFEGLFLLFKIDESFSAVAEDELRKEIQSNVFNTIINIAKEIGREGREGRRVGTGFIIGDSKDVMKNSIQLILNPFQSKKHNIMNVGIKETVKEFAQLDGMFVIDDDGTILSAGRYISADAEGIELPGLGARHHSAASITRQTNAIAVVVSESGGLIRVFRNGKIIMEEAP